MNEDISAFCSALNKGNVDYSAMSWNGFNLFGDRKSIAEVQRLQYVEARFKAFQLYVKNGWITKDNIKVDE